MLWRSRLSAELGTVPASRGVLRSTETFALVYSVIKGRRSSPGWNLPEGWGPNPSPHREAATSPALSLCWWLHATASSPGGKLNGRPCPRPGWASLTAHARSPQPAPWGWRGSSEACVCGGVGLGVLSGKLRVGTVWGRAGDLPEALNWGPWPSGAVAWSSLSTRGLPGEPSDGPGAAGPSVPFTRVSSLVRLLCTGGGTEARRGWPGPAVLPGPGCGELAWVGMRTPGFC